MIYSTPGAQESLSQGDILDDCPLLYWEFAPSMEAETPPRAVITRARVVVLTQACDLAQPKSTRVLVAIVHQARDLVERSILKSSLIRDHIRSHRVYGWYFLPKGEALPESIVDLRHLHTIPRVLLDRLIAEQKRVTRVATPYREHLAQHFATTYSRIGLPRPYETEED
jgi:hypothetical protein